jgi:hypothetical protein
MTSPCCFEPRDHRGLDGDRLPEAIDAAPARGPKRSGGWRRGDFLASRGMGEAQGKKVAPPPLRLRRSRRSRPTARSSQGEAVGRAPNSILGRSRGQSEGACKGARLTGRRDGGHGTKKGCFASEAVGADRHFHMVFVDCTGSRLSKRSNGGRSSPGQMYDLHRAASPTR